MIGIDLDAIERELCGMYREGVRQFDELQRTWGALAGELESWFEADGCG